MKNLSCFDFESIVGQAVEIIYLNLSNYSNFQAAYGILNEVKKGESLILAKSTGEPYWPINLTKNVILMVNILDKEDFKKNENVYLRMTTPKIPERG